MKHSIITVLGRDRPGIVANVTKIFSSHKANLEDLRMSVLEGEFAMILIAQHGEKQDQKLVKALESLGKEEKLKIHWQPVTRKLKRQSLKKNHRTYLITAFGKDQTGIVHQISQLLAKKNCNILDLQCQILGSGKQSLYSSLLEVVVPKPDETLKSLQAGLKRIQNKMKIEINLKPAELLEL